MTDLDLDARWEAFKREQTERASTLGRPTERFRDPLQQHMVGLPVSWLVWLQNEGRRLTHESILAGHPKKYSIGAVVRRLLEGQAPKDLPKPTAPKDLPNPSDDVSRRHITPADGNIFADLGFPPEKATELLKDADARAERHPAANLPDPPAGDPSVFD